MHFSWKSFTSTIHPSSALDIMNEWKLICAFYSLHIPYITPIPFCIIQCWDFFPFLINAQGLHFPHHVTMALIKRVKLPHTQCLLPSNGQVHVSSLSKISWHFLYTYVWSFYVIEIFAFSISYSYMYII